MREELHMSGRLKGLMKYHVPIFIYIHLWDLLSLFFTRLINYVMHNDCRLTIMKGTYIDDHLLFSDFAAS
jgi:hypothetical protein